MIVQEIEQENYYIENLESSSKSSSLQEEKSYPYSFNNREIPKNQYSDSEIKSNNEINKSFDFNHEERMERIRKKYGNSLMIKILLKKKLEEIRYNNILKEEYGDDCTICMNNFTNNILIYKTPCEHIFHKECFDKYLKNIKSKDKLICPNCNQNLIINKKFLTLRTKAHKLDIDKKEDIQNNKNNEKDSKYIEIEDEINDINNKKDGIIIVKKKKDNDNLSTTNNIKDKNDINIKGNIFDTSNDLKYKSTEVNQNKENNNNLFHKKKI